MSNVEWGRAEAPRLGSPSPLAPQAAPLSDDYRVLVNHDKFIEEGVPGQKLADFDGHRLFLPSDPKYWPEQTHLSWHRANRFGAAGVHTV